MINTILYLIIVDYCFDKRILFEILFIVFLHCSLFIVFVYCLLFLFFVYCFFSLFIVFFIVHFIIG
jgi:hypothetical protein